MFCFHKLGWLLTFAHPQKNRFFQGVIATLVEKEDLALEVQREKTPSSNSSLPFAKIQPLRIFKDMLISKCLVNSMAAVKLKNDLDSWLFLEKGC